MGDQDSMCLILWNEFSNGQGYFASDGLERGVLWRVDRL